MVKNGRKNLLAGAGLLVAGVAAGAIGMMSLRGGDGPYASSPPTRSMGAAPASTAFITAVAGNCELAPILPGAGDGDGRAVLQSKPGAGTADEVASLILSGKEAAAAGRQRDAEVDFLNACRNAAALPDADPIPLADAMYQLGRHYANVGAFGSPKAKELYQRSERLYSASLEAFRARYGAEHEKTRFAQEGLTTVQHATGGKAPTAIAKAPPAPAPVVAAPAPAPVAAAPEPAPAPAPVAAAPAPAPQAAAKAPEPKPAAPKVAEPKPAEPKVATPAPAQPRATARRSEPAAEPAAEAPAPRPRTEARRPAPIVDTNPSEVAADTPAPVRRPPPVTVVEPDGQAPAASGSTGMGAPASSFGGSSSGTSGSSGEAPTAEGAIQ